jgi:hypothetical protein
MQIPSDLSLGNNVAKPADQNPRRGRDSRISLAYSEVSCSAFGGFRGGLGLSNRRIIRVTACKAPGSKLGAASKLRKNNRNVVRASVVKSELDKLGSPVRQALR